MKHPRSNLHHPEKLQSSSAKPCSEISSQSSNRKRKPGRLLPSPNPGIGSWRLGLPSMLDVGCWMFLSLLLSTTLFAQDRLKTMPGYEHYQRASHEMTNAVKLGILTVTWTNEGKAFDYQKDGKRYHYDIAARTATELPPAKTNAPAQTDERPPGERRRTRGHGGPARGRQASSAISPDGKLKAFYHDRNLRLSDANGENEIAVTHDGSEQKRIKYGTASWVYGEELDQTTAIWWSTKSDKVEFYRFDESPVADFYLVRNLTNIQEKVGDRAFVETIKRNLIAIR